MLSRSDKNYARRVWAETSDTVRDWITERLEADASGNAWAEEQLKHFIKLHKELGSGVQAHRRMYGEYEQQKLS